MRIDIFMRLPKSKSAWSIYLGDYYFQNEIKINDVVFILLSHLQLEIGPEHSGEEDITQLVQEYLDVWDNFCEGSNFGDSGYFPDQLFGIVPELKKPLENHQSVE